MPARYTPRHLPALHHRKRRRDRVALFELVERSLDNGVRIEGRRCRPVLGIDMLALDYRALLVSWETHLAYAEAVLRTVEVPELDDGVFDDEEL